MPILWLGTYQSKAMYPTSFGNKYPPALYGYKDGFTCRVILSNNSSAGISRCYVAIVNASNVSEAYDYTWTDPYGNFQFTDINATYSLNNNTGNPAVGNGSLNAGLNAYMLYANKSPYGECYSQPFGIGTEAGDNAEVIALLSLPDIQSPPNTSASHGPVISTDMHPGPGMNITVSGQNFTPNGTAILYSEYNESYTANVDKNGNTSWTYTNRAIAQYPIYAVDVATNTTSNTITVQAFLNDYPPTQTPTPSPFAGTLLILLSICTATLIRMHRKRL
jgi:hypothetical protein